MSENLLRASEIKLFGRLMVGLELDPSAASTGTLGANRFLKQQLSHKDARLARIYGYSFEGHYYHLSQPVILVVHGKGTSAAINKLDAVGVEAPDWGFTSDLRMWEYDKGDFSLRLDIESGPLEQILLETELDEDRLQMHYSGRKVQTHYSGRKVQLHYSGRKVRSGGD